MVAREPGLVRISISRPSLALLLRSALRGDQSGAAELEYFLNIILAVVDTVSVNKLGCLRERLEQFAVISHEEDMILLSPDPPARGQV